MAENSFSTYISHTAKLLEAHAESEQELLLQAKEELQGKAEQH